MQSTNLRTRIAVWRWKLWQAFVAFAAAVAKRIPFAGDWEPPRPKVIGDDQRQLVYPDVVKLHVYVLRLRCPACKVASDISDDDALKLFAKGHELRVTCTDCGARLLLARSRVKAAAARVGR